ncbi:hypothetical protein CFC21_083184 [Triticum aestivum]|uniref:Uncharacterized protein n=3 Tax=Triticum TaxID=4564 RepID=A0A9R0XZG1_TRITD|nr:hypothetical protein CFC21_083184 [Triticum aestivum]VAI45307.1 unnamed protein product [Triticum turgidum subsp. durum]
MADIAVDKGDSILAPRWIGGQFRLTMEAEHLMAEVHLEAEHADIVAPTELYTNQAFVVENTPSSRQ